MNLILLFRLPFIILLITIPLLIIGSPPQIDLLLSIIMFLSGVLILSISKQKRIQKNADAGIAATDRKKLNKILNILGYVSIITGLFFLAVHIIIANII